MKRSLVLAMVMGVVSVSTVLAVESYKVVEVIELNDDSEYRVMSDSELATLKADIKMEERCMSKAYAAAAEEWKSINKSRIPIGQPNKGRSFKIDSSFMNQEAANKKLEDLQTHKEKVADARLSRESKKAKLNTKAVSLADKEKAEKKAERTAEKEDALNILKAKLEAVIAQEKEKAAKAAEAAGAK